MNKEISLIGVPMDLGQNRRGVDVGPSAIRYAGIVDKLKRLHYDVKDLGDIEISRPKVESIHNDEQLRNLYEVVETNKRLAQMVDKEKNRGRFPLVLGGDHSIAIGTIAGVANHYENLGVIWYDAHGDINTEKTSPSGNIHGMSLAISLGFGNESLTTILGKKPKIKPENVVLVGTRSLDEGEKDLLKKHQIKVYTMHEIDRLGMAKVMEETMEHLKHCDGVHLSFDLDGIDPSEAPGVGTAVIGGLTYRESHLAMEMLSESKLITSAEFVEVNPLLDEKNKTALLTVQLVGSLFGEKLI